MDELKSLCKGFTTIGLSDMGAVRLMNRREVKYTVHRRVLPLILKRIVNDYHILEMERQHIMPYRSVYFDTRDYRLYTSHQNGKLNR